MTNFGKIVKNLSCKEILRRFRMNYGEAWENFRENFKKILENCEKIKII